MWPALRTSRRDLRLPDPFASVRAEMDQLFDRFFNQGDGGQTLFRNWYAPVSLWEDDQHLYVEMEAPGITKDDLDLTIENGTLHIRADRKEPQGERKYWYNERQFGAMERVVSLPEVVDPDKIEAELAGGVLSLKLTKRPESQPRRIAVKAR